MSDNDKAAAKEPIRAAGAPAAIGPYSQGVSCGGLIFTSGQLPIDGATGRLESDIRAAARICLENVAGIIEAAGSDVGRILKVTVYLADMADFEAVNAVYADFFAGCVPPARSCVQAAALPRGARLEIEAVAAR